MKSPCLKNGCRRIPLLILGALILLQHADGYARFAGRRDSLLALASRAVERQEWGEGASIADKLLEENSGDPDGHYYGAVCRRELGKRTSFLLREIQWSKARNHFSAVFARDSSYRDILYQYALFQEYDDELADAVEIAREQVVRHPEQAASLLGLIRMGRHYIADTDPGEARHWLEGRQDVYSRYFLAELLRRHGRFREAEPLLLQIQEKSDLPPQATCLSLARLYAALGKDGEELAQATYWNGVESVASPFGAGLLLGDLIPVIDDDELMAYAALRTDSARIVFFHSFWESRDPAPSSRVNARLIEHLRRYARAEKEYAFYGVRTLARNPDPALLGLLPRSFFLNAEFNDMGLIYLRHGDPDAMQVTTSMSDDNLSWLYNATETVPARIFMFARRLGVSNDWRLTSVPTDPQMKSKVALWDSRYGVDPFRWPQVDAQLEAERTSSVSAALRTEHHTWEAGTKEVMVPHSVEAFRAEQGRTLLDISYAIPLEEFGEIEGDSLATIPVEVGISFISLKGKKSRRELDTLQLPASAGTTGSYIALFRRTLLPDSVRIAMHVRGVGRNVIGTWSEYRNVAGFQGTGFSLSDVQLLLPSTRPASIEIEGVRIVQSPFRAYRRTAEVYSYVQVYNLVRDADGKAKYTAVFELVPADPTHADESIRLGEVTRDLAEESRSEFYRIDLSGAPPGHYLLRATVTDRKRVETLTRERAIDVLP